MRPEDFDFIAKMLKDRSGLVISRDKAYLLESRLTPVARKRGLKGLGPRRSSNNPEWVNKKYEVEAYATAIAGPAENVEAAEADFMRQMTQKYGFTEAEARAIDKREMQGHASRAAYWTAQGWTPAERARRAFERRAAKSYAYNSALRDAAPVRARGYRMDIPPYWWRMFFLIFLPLLYYGVVVFFRGEFVAAYVSRCVMAALAVVCVFCLGHRAFTQLQDQSIRLARTTWLGMVGWGLTTVMGPLFLLLPALYGGAYFAHISLASSYTEAKLIADEKGMYSADTESGRIKFCFQPQHKSVAGDEVRGEISRSPIGVAAAAYYLGGERFESYCQPRQLPSGRF